MYYNFKKSLKTLKEVTKFLQKMYKYKIKKKIKRQFLR